MRRNKRAIEGGKVGKWLMIGFLALMFISALSGEGTDTQDFVPTTTEEKLLANKKRWQENLNNARTDITYDNLMRKPDDYFGEFVKYSGRVIQTITDDGGVKQRVALNDDYTEIVLIMYSKELLETRILDDDYVTFTGLTFRTITYETVLGNTREIPVILASSIYLE